MRSGFRPRKGKVLLGNRSATRAFYPNICDVFGGPLETGESREGALRRELREELRIIPTEWRFLLTFNEPDEAAANGADQYHFFSLRVGKARREICSPMNTLRSNGSGLRKP